jgi:hypothetical protein
VIEGWGATPGDGLTLPRKAKSSGVAPVGSDGGHDISGETDSTKRPRAANEETSEDCTTNARLAEDTHKTGAVFIVQDVVVWDVRPERIAACRESGGVLAPAGTRPQPLDLLLADDAACKMRVDDFEPHPIQLDMEHDLSFL